MIYLHTGKPGAGKTLYTVAMLKELSERDNRPVYYSGIQDVKITGWIELKDPSLWYECPPNSIILIDECQRLFRVRQNGSAVPRCVAELETHRHLGVDLYLITQHPMLIDTNIRRLVNQHLHMVDVFGSGITRVNLFRGCKDYPEKSVKDADVTDWKHDKSIYGLYKSAEFHTKKKQIPKQVYLFFAIPFVLAVLGYVGYGWYSDSVKPKTDKKPELVKDQQYVVKPPDQQIQSTPKEYISAHVPRIDGLSFSAPMYDKMTEPSRVPVPAGCVSDSKRCNCYSQDATRLPMPDNLCRQIVKEGIFIPFETDRSKGQVFNAQSAQIPVSAPNTSSARTVIRGLPEADDYNGFNHRGPVLSFDRGGQSISPQVDQVAQPVIEQDRYVGRMRVPNSQPAE